VSNTHHLCNNSAAKEDLIFIHELCYYYNVLEKQPLPDILKRITPHVACIDRLWINMVFMQKNSHEKSKD